jgi:type I restriction enzyme R subunit
MNEAETRAELIDPKLKISGWGVAEGSKVFREFLLTHGKIQTGGGRAKPLIADYVLEYRGRKLAVIEAKSAEQAVGEGVAQAKNYAEKMHLDYTFSSNGREIYQICMKDGREGLVGEFPAPQTLWDMVFSEQNAWREKFDRVPFEDVGRTKEARYYQEIAVNKAMDAIADGKQRILLTLATGTGKTFIAFQIAWKLFHTRWNLQRNGTRLPRILFLADRNILADQAFNAFSAFPEDALIRIKPGSIRKNGQVPTNGSIFFTIFQTFMCGEGDTFYFGQYPKDFFDFIVIDECHRGGANDESNWREIMEYFSPAVQLGLTATPKRQDNADTYRYFGDPVYIYSLKEGINDGFLTPFKVKRINTTLDDYMYTSDDILVEGEIEEGKLYIEPDFNRIIEIKEREAKRVKIYLADANQNDKAIVFCASQDHAAAIRDLINQFKDSHEPNYCTRVTANDGELGEQYLREFQDNEKSIPTILTTSQKLSTGIDARNIRNIVLLRPINSMIEFKQIVGRGTRLFDGKDYFTIYDFVDAYHHFSDPEWDGEPIAPEPSEPPAVREPGPDEPYEPVEREEAERRVMAQVKLRDGKEREIQHMIATSFWSAGGKPVSAQEFLEGLFGVLPEFFADEAELRKIWSLPSTRRALLNKLADAGYGKDELTVMQKLIDAENSDLFDVLEYVSFAIKPISREVRVANAQSSIFAPLNVEQKQFLEFVLSKYIETGVDELDDEKLPNLLSLKYHAIVDAIEKLGDVKEIREVFVGFQKNLYTSEIG